MVKPLEFYQTQIEGLNKHLAKQKRINRIIITVKLLLIAFFLFFIYKWLSETNSLYLLTAVTHLIVFMIVYRYDIGFMHRLKITRNLLIININEMNALKGDYSAFNAGDKYADSSHPYSFDLDLFVRGGLFQAVNRTVTHEGEKRLAEWMLQTDVKPGVVNQRQEAVESLRNMAEWRQLYTAIGAIEPLSLAKLVTYFKENATVNIKPWQRWSYYALIALTLGALAANIAGFCGFQPWLLLFIVNLMVVASRIKTTNAIYGKVNGAYKIISRYHELLLHIKQYSGEMQGECLNRITHILTKDNINSLKAFDDLKKLLGRFDQRANVMVTIGLNGFILSDILLLMRYNKWVNAYASQLQTYENAIAEMDALVSLANFAFNHPDFVVPQLSDSEMLVASQLGHPLIDANIRVCNDFSVDKAGQFYITTGANMAGKSTFLRTVGVNMILASCGAPVCAASYRFMPMKLFSSMRTSDNLVNHTSYFQAELMRLKSLIDLAAKGEKLFVILDEILKGTNSKDKLAGSRLFLLKMLSYNCSGMIATHDLALGELEAEYPGHFINICFEITIQDDDIIYDYKLQKGVAHNLNATWLLNRLLE
jgi:hypothetical protein